MKITKKKTAKQALSEGSALILAVVLTSLLAIIGVFFVLVARVDQTASMAVVQNRDLDLAVETVLSKICEELVLDVPGAAGPAEEYYDYPDHSLAPGLDDRLQTWDDQTIDPGPDLQLGTPDDGPPVSGSGDNIWLASLEPESIDRNIDNADPNSPPGNGRPGFRHITDLYGRLGFLFQDSFLYDPQGTGKIKDNRLDSDGDRISFRNLPAKIIAPTEPIGREGDKADADGDGVADSRWIVLPNMKSSKGLDIYAAARIIDNGGMINVNTTYAGFVPPDARAGDMLTDIYLDELVKSSNDKDVAMANFLNYRSNAPDPRTYYLEAARRIDNPDTTTGHFYDLYDITEELSLRNRFILFPYRTLPRLEAGSDDDPARCLSTTLRWSGYGNSRLPYTESDFDAWKRRFDPFDPGYWGSEPRHNNYDFRHLLTTYNMDRIISPDGGRMANLMWHDKVSLYEAIRRWADEMIQRGLLDVGVVDPNAVAAQMAVNIIDFRDGPGYDPSDHNYEAPDQPTVFLNPDDGLNYYGFERPCVYISELASVYQVDPNDPNLVHRSYAVEFHKPYPEDNDPCGWQLAIYNPDDLVTPDRQYDIDWTGSSRFHAIVFENPQAPLLPLADFNDANDTEDPNSSDPNAAPTAYYISPGETIFDAQYDLQLQRPAGGSYAVVDSVQVPVWLVTRLASDACQVSYQRDITRHKCIRRLWDISASEQFKATLGHMNTYQRLGDAHTIQAHPANRSFTNVGEIGMIFRRPHYYLEGQDPVAAGTIGYGPDANSEDKVRIDMGNPAFQHLTNYLTLFDPSFDGIDNDGDSMVADEQDPAMTPEFKIPGRININTAPWYVIGQLPWLAFDQLHPGEKDANLARAIVAYRDKRPLVDTRSIPAFVIADYTNRTATTESPLWLREDPGFASTAELANVVNRFDKPHMDPNYRNFSMRYYLDGLDQLGFPDLSFADGAVDDFEERDLILTRISNLVTVRSDVFSAYILVRIGADGPQKRVLAILDRSNVYTPDDRVRIRALHPAPDPW